MTVRAQGAVLCIRMELLPMQAQSTIWTRYAWEPSFPSQRKPSVIFSLPMKLGSCLTCLTWKKSTWFTMTTSRWWHVCTKSWSKLTISSSKNSLLRSRETTTRCSQRQKALYCQVSNLPKKRNPKNRRARLTKRPKTTKLMTLTRTILSPRVKLRILALFQLCNETNRIMLHSSIDNRYPFQLACSMEASVSTIAMLTRWQTKCSSRSTSSPANYSFSSTRSSRS